MVIKKLKIKLSPKKNKICSKNFYFTNNLQSKTKYKKTKRKQMINVLTD